MADQIRIAADLDSQLGQAARAKDATLETLRAVDALRAALLNKAFERERERERAASMRLGDLCDIRIGRTPDRGNPLYWQGGLPWATISDMITSPIVTTRESIAQLAASKFHLRPVEPGTLLYSFKLTIGRMAIAGRELYTNEAIAALVPKGPGVSTEYLRLALLTVPTETATHAVKGRTLNSASLADLVVPIVEPMRQPRFVEKVSAELTEASAIHQAVSQRFHVAVGLPQAILERTFPHDAGSPRRQA